MYLRAPLFLAFYYIAVGFNAKFQRVTNFRPLEILIRTLVSLAEIAFVHISTSFVVQNGSTRKEAGWTSTLTSFSRSAEQRSAGLTAGLTDGTANESGHWAVRTAGVVSGEAGCDRDRN